MKPRQALLLEPRLPFLEAPVVDRGGDPEYPGSGRGLGSHALGSRELEALGGDIELGDDERVDVAEVVGVEILQLPGGDHQNAKALAVFLLRHVGAVAVLEEDDVDGSETAA